MFAIAKFGLLLCLVSLDKSDVDVAYLPLLKYLFE